MNKFIECHVKIRRNIFVFNWNVKYSGIIFTKRRFGIFIDDKAFNSE
jgi:hypothetical protein